MRMIKHTTITSVIFSTAVLSGCATTSHNVPKATENSLTSASQEISNIDVVIPKYWSDEDAEKKLYEIYAKLAPAAKEICTHVGEDECWWEIEYSDEDELNAYASGESKVVIHKGILKYAETDDEIAMVIAHEVSHHIANHMEEKIQNAQAGALLVGALTAFAVGYSGGYSYNPYSAQTTINNGVQAGAMAGALSYSKAQESEADYLSAHILSHAGFDLDKAKKMLLIMGKKSGKKSSGAFDSHPAGPERVAQWNQVREKLAINPTTMPERKEKTENDRNTNEYEF